jgi:hypothetical protein|tara:strand:+ start:23 stop:394 length:372 start_codon:yes stop_codon:yes gene_type:complete
MEARQMKYDTEDRARHFLVRNILDIEGKITDIEHAESEGAIPIRDIRGELQMELSTLHSLLSGVDTGAIVPVFEDKNDEPKFMAHPELEQNQTLIDAWAEVNEMLEDSFIENNDEWYLYVIAG